MEQRSFGWTRVPVASIGLGTFRLEREARGDAIAAIRRGLDAGMTHIDTAEIYGADPVEAAFLDVLAGRVDAALHRGVGQVEMLVGEAIRGRRHEVFLASKAMPHPRPYADIIRACERSLERLGTDHLDLYLLHWPGEDALTDDSLAGAVRAFEQLERDGKIRYFGVSNFEVPLLERAVAIVGERRIACNQVRYHLRAREIEDAIAPWCDRHDIAVVGYSPLGAGACSPLDGVGGQVLREIAAAHACSPAQVALRFLLHDPRRFLVCKATSAGHLAENAAAARLALTGDELGRIARAFAAQTTEGLS